MRYYEPIVTVIIPNWNGISWLPGCLDGLKNQLFLNFEIILVDNHSTDGSLSLVQQKYPFVEVYRCPKNLGFSTAVNIGIKKSKSKYVALLNTDTRPQSNWLGSLVEQMDQSSADVGALSSKMLNMENPDLTENAGDFLCWQGAAIKRGHGKPANMFKQIEEIFSPCAGAVLYKRSFLEKMGGFDESFFAYLEDIDLGLRGRLAGYRYLFVPSAEIYHHGHGSELARSHYVRLMTRNRLLLFLKNIPLGLLFKHAGKILYGQLYFFIVYKRPLASFLGYLSFVKKIPGALRERFKILKSIRISLPEIDQMLLKEMSEPPLLSIMTRKYRAWRSHPDRNKSSG
jgi:GT2 family glycosyltransferase